MTAPPPIRRFACLLALVLLPVLSAATATTAEDATPPPASGPAMQAPPVEAAGQSLEALRAENRRLRQRVEELDGEDRIPPLWLAVGFVGQFVFGLRFVVQWIATEIRRQSVIPLAFWYLSLGGTVILLSYSIYRRDWVFIAGFSLNMIIYLRNLYFIHRGPGAGAPAVGEGSDDPANA